MPTSGTPVLPGFPRYIPPFAKNPLVAAEDSKADVDSAISIQIGEYLKRTLAVLDDMDKEIESILHYEETLRERVERDIKAATCDRIVALLNTPLE